MLSHNIDNNFMNQLNRLALANTFGLIDLILHPAFHLWVWLAPGSYEKLMGLFVAGLHLQVTEFDTSIVHVAAGTLIEALTFWVFGFVAATVYNGLCTRTNVSVSTGGVRDTA